MVRDRNWMGWVAAIVSLWLGFVGTVAWADPGIRLPNGEDPEAWAGPLRLAGLAPRADDARLRLEVVDETWRIVAVAADGQERRVVVEAPDSAGDRETIAFLARGLLREVLRTDPRRAADPSSAERVPTDKVSGEAEGRPSPRKQGTTDRGGVRPGPATKSGAAPRFEPSGTDEPPPVEPTEEPTEIYVTDLPRWRVEGRKVLAAPPLWVRMGGAIREGTLGSASIMAGTEVFRKGRLRLNVEFGGVVARDLELDLIRRFGQFDVEGSATVDVVGPVALGVGIGGSYRMYRQQFVMIDQHLVPTAQARLDVPLVSGRKFALVAHVQGKLDLARTELVLPNGELQSLSPVEIQPALILRYHGALDLLSNHRRKP